MLQNISVYDQHVQSFVADGTTVEIFNLSQNPFSDTPLETVTTSGGQIQTSNLSPGTYYQALINGKIYQFFTTIDVPAPQYVIPVAVSSAPPPPATSISYVTSLPATGYEGQMVAYNSSGAYGLYTFTQGAWTPIGGGTSAVKYSDILVQTSLTAPTGGYNPNYGLPVDGLSSILYGGASPFMTPYGSAGKMTYMKLNVPTLPSGAIAWKITVKASLYGSFANIPGQGHYHLAVKGFLMTQGSTLAYVNRATNTYYDGTTNDTTTLALDGEMTIFTTKSNTTIGNIYITSSLLNSFTSSDSIGLTVCLDFEPILDKSGYVVAMTTAGNAGPQ